MARVKRKTKEINAVLETLVEMVRLADSGRCMACGWPLESSAARGCVLGNCSFRPQSDEQPYARWKERTEVLVFARKPMEERRAKHSA